jgi:hypothetical protein
MHQLADEFSGVEDERLLGKKPLIFGVRFGSLSDHRLISHFDSFD